MTSVTVFGGQEDAASVAAMDGARLIPEQTSIFGFRVNPLTGAEVTQMIEQAVDTRQRLVMGNINTHAMARMFESPRMAALLMQDDACVMLDSMPLLFALNMSGHALPRSKRTTSLDFYDDMFTLGASKGWKFAFVGGRPETLPAGLAELRNRFPGLTIGGRHGYFDEKDTRPGSVHSEVIAWLRDESPDVVIVGMGMPRQEEWTALIQHQVDARVFLMAGAYLDYQVGIQHPAPRWLGQVGMEWAYRLVRSPRRLGYRYLVEPMVLMTRLLLRRHPQRLPAGERAGRIR